MTVLDASAVLALVHDEPGAVTVAQALVSARLGAANLAEVIGKLVDAEVGAGQSRRSSAGAGERDEFALEADHVHTHLSSRRAWSWVVATMTRRTTCPAGTSKRDSPLSSVDY